MECVMVFPVRVCLFVLLCHLISLLLWALRNGFFLLCVPCLRIGNELRLCTSSNDSSPQ